MLFAHFTIFKYCSFLERPIQSEHSGTAEVEWGDDAQESIVVVLLEAEDDAEAGIKGTPGEGEVAAVGTSGEVAAVGTSSGEVAAVVRNTFPRW